MITELSWKASAELQKQLTLDEKTYLAISVNAICLAIQLPAVHFIRCAHSVALMIYYLRFTIDHFLLAASQCFHRCPL